MGLNAFVRCRCWEGGATTEPPIPRECVEADPGNNMLYPTFPSEGHEEAYAQFYQWRYDACPHENMVYVSERIGSYVGVYRFTSALDHAGPDLFPVLLAELGNANGASTSPQSAAEALEELELLPLADLGEAIKLIDEDSRAKLYSWAGEEWICAANPWRIGFDPRGFFVRNIAEQEGREEFRAMRLTQTVLAHTVMSPTDLTRTEPTNEGEADWQHAWSVRLTQQWLARPQQLCVVRLAGGDGEGQLVLPLSTPIEAELSRQPDDRWTWKPGDYYPRRMAVVQEPVAAEEYGYAVDTLTTVFRAAVEVGQPVTWC